MDKGKRTLVRARLVLAMLSVASAACNGEGASGSSGQDRGTLTPDGGVGSVGGAASALVHDAPPTGFGCELAAFLEHGQARGQLVQASVQPIGSRQDIAVARDIVGTIFDQDGHALYALTGRHDARPGTILRFEASPTGTTETEVATAGRNLTGLAALPDGSLWAWEPARGLVRFSTDFSAVEDVFSSRINVDALAWSHDGPLCQRELSPPPGA